MKAIIKKAEVGDIEALNKISAESKMHWDYPPEWMEKWKDDLALKERDFLDECIFKLEKEPGATIGFCSIKEGENEYEITHLWIKPTFIGKGYGKFLLHESIQRIVIKEKPIVVVADPNAEFFYASQGFFTYDRKPS